MAFDSKQGHPIKGGDANNKHSMNSSSRGVSSEKFYTLFIVQVLLSTEFLTKSPTVSEFEKISPASPLLQTEWSYNQTKNMLGNQSKTQ